MEDQVGGARRASGVQDEPGRVLDEPGQVAGVVIAEDLEPGEHHRRGGWWRQRWRRNGLASLSEAERRVRAGVAPEEEVEQATLAQSDAAVIEFEL